MSGSSRLSHFPALDGFRGLAVAGVVAFHAGLGAAGGGFLGVSAFFTLSGFLITSLLLAEREATGRIDLRAFWARRARRLLPASFAALVLIVAFGTFAADPDQVRRLRGDVLGALSYVANWRFLVDGRSYARLFATPSPVQHFWSLAVEEQLYVVLPLLVVGLLLLGGRRRRTWLAGGLAVAAVASVAVSLVVDDTDRVYYGTDTRAAELLAGALLAVALSGHLPLPPGRTRRAIVVAGPPALAAVLALWVFTDRSSPWLYEGGLALHALPVVVVIAAAVHEGPVARLLAFTPLRALGRISYGVYLFHWPVFLWIGPGGGGRNAAAALVARLSITLALATASYLWLEQPIRSGRRLTGWQPVVAVPVAAVVVAGATVFVTADPPAPTVVLEPIAAAPPAVQDAPGSASIGFAASSWGSRQGPVRSRGVGIHRSLESARPVRVLVVGDSVGITLGRGLEHRAATVGDVQVWNIARMYCGIGRNAERLLMGVQKAETDGCSDWPARWADAVERFDPDTVVVLSTIWELIDRRRAEWPEFLGLGDSPYDRWIVAEYVDALDVLSTRGARIAWLTIPCTRDRPDAPGTRLAHLNDHVLPAVAKLRPDTVEIVDLSAHVCPDGRFAERLGHVDDARPDGTHFSDAGANEAASWLVPRLLGE